MENRKTYRRQNTLVRSLDCSPARLFHGTINLIELIRELIRLRQVQSGTADDLVNSHKLRLQNGSRNWQAGQFRQIRI